jgi:KipI family sensor histidine kinase inhibitor
MSAAHDSDATILPLGSRAVLVRFGEALSAEANERAIAFAASLDSEMPDGVEEVAPGLVSVLLRIRGGTDFWRLSGQLRLRLGSPAALAPGAVHEIAVSFDGEDLAQVARLTGLTRAEFVARHNSAPLRVLATGFAPGFVYCGFHAAPLIVPRREQVRPHVPAGTILFAAGQTAVAATSIRSGWHVIGATSFRNFDPDMAPPTRLAAGDTVRFVERS